MSQSVQSSMKLSKEVSEESYSKTSISSSSTKMMSASVESSESVSSLQRLGSTEGDSVDSLMKEVMGDRTSLVSKMSDDLLGGSSVVSSTEKSTSVKQSEGEFSYKSEMKSSYEMQESKKSVTAQSSKEVSMTKSVESSAEKTVEAVSSGGEESPTFAVEKEPVYVVIMDYTPREGDKEGLPVSEGQEVEVVDSSKAHKWRVRLRQTTAGSYMMTEGTVPSCYLEKKEIQSPPTTPPVDPKMQLWFSRREKVLKELVESEEDFARDMQYVVNNHFKEMESKQMPKDLRDYKDTLFTNFKAISEFHNNVLMKGIQYYRNEPARLGKTFIRLERDFDMHVAYCRDEPEAQQLLKSGPLKDYFDEFSRKLKDEKSLSEHLKLPIQRLNDYQLLLKELIKYTARLKEDTTDLEKAHDFMQAIPQRIEDLQYLNSIQGYRGNLHKLGRILKHDWFEVTDGNNLRRERFAFLFKGRMFITDAKRVGADRQLFLVKYIIKFADVEIVDNADDDDLKLRFQHLRKDQAGFPLTLKAKTIEQKEDWLKVIQVTAIPQGLEELEDDEAEPIIEEPEAKKTKLDDEKSETRVEVLEDFEAYEEMHTVITESVRSGSLTSLDDFQSALEDEASLCFTASEAESGGPGRPRFVKPLRASSCVEGTVATLECEVAASPLPVVAWLKDNQPLKPSPRASLETDGTRQRLIIKNTEAADAGLYTIIASNVHGTMSCSAPLAVHSGPETLPPSTPGGSPMPYGPIFLEKLRDMELQEGTAFRVSTVVQGEPTPTVSFYKDDQEIKKDGRVHFSQESKDCYELVIENVLPEDSGKYSCVAMSSAGQNITSCNLTVTSQKVFVKPPEVDVAEIGTPELTEPDPQWVKDIEFEASERFKVSIDEAEDTVALVFQHVTPDGAGMYTCAASTSGGKISCSAELTVQGGVPRDPEAPKTSSAATKVEAKEGGSALLELTATGFPKPKIAWSKGGEELKPGDKYMILQEDDETYTMAIKNVTKDDSGEYKALAANELGESALSYELDVTCAPKFIKQMKDSSVLKDETMKFEVEVDGRPEPTVTWCKDGQQLSEGGRIKFEAEGNIRRLVIKKTVAEDAGNYSCIIKNKGGSQGGFGALQVKTPASFVQGLKDTRVSQGQDANLRVRISGNPKPEFKWKKDGSDVKVDGTTIIQREESSEDYTLIIKKTTFKDQGRYTCEVKNEYGKDESSGKLTVKGKPVFSQELKDKTVKEGEKNVDLTVKIEGDAKPNVRWYIGDMEITETTNYKIHEDEDEGTFSLKIKEVTPKVAGVYKCEASNEVGKNATSGTVTVVEETKTTPPRFLQSLKDCSVKEGEDANFTIKIAGQPNPTTKWTKDGSELTIDNKRVKIISEEEDSFTLVIKETTKQDGGNYTCTITNSSGSESSSSKLTVTETEQKPSFRQGLKDVTVKEEETVKFTVKIAGSPKPTAKWNKDGAELTIDNKKVKVTSEAEDSLTLIINRAAKVDAGEYSCIITNKVGSEKTTSKLIVKESENKPTFEEGLKDNTVKEKETLKLKVKFSGKPKPEAKWNKDGADLTIPSDRTKVISEEDDSLTLVIDQVTKTDAGKYSCTIKNSSGTETTSSKVVVTDSETKPTFELGLKDQTVKEEETVKLKVKFTGTPKPAAKWNKDGAELTLPGDRMKVVSEEEDSLTLIISPASKDDTGKFSCVITNTCGSETTSSKVTVTESEKPPSFIQGLKNISCKEEETVKLTVKFKGQPKPTAKWTKDGSELTIDSKRVKLITEADDTLTVVIDKATLNDSGKYSCTISNTSGKETSDCQLTVAEFLKAPTFRQGLKDITVREEDTVKFVIKFDGKPKPTAKWTKDGAELTIDGKKIRTVSEAEDSLTVIIDQVRKDDAGKYSCTITNTSGSETTSSKLTVSDAQASPSFKQGLVDQDITEGDTAKMTVVFTGKPMPSAKWTLDGSELTIDGKHIQTKTEADNSLTLIINQATKEDVGKYSCILTNSSGTASSSGKIRIKASPIFVKGLQDIEGEEGGGVRLNVKYIGEPEPVASWKKDGAPLDIDGRHVKVAMDADGSESLVLECVKKDDVGVYSCEIKNPHGSSSTSGKLSVTGKPVIRKKLEDKEVLAGESIDLIVEIRATPPADIKWFLNDREVTANDSYEMVDDKTKGVYKLTVKKAKLDQQGKYRCEASNPSGKADTSGTVTVLVKPAFLKSLSDCVVTEGENVKLETSATGNPKPDVTWFKDKKQLSPSNRYVISSAEDSYCLTIKDTVIEDSSTYTCKAQNKSGEISQSAVVTVKSKRETQGPRFLSHLSDQIIVVGDAARFEVRIVGKPAPQVKWYKNEEELVGSDDVIIKSDTAENTYTLTLKNLEIKDSATYTCKAVNESGDAQESAKLTVKEPVAPKIEGLEDIEVRFGAPARIKAKISGFPKPEVKWLKNNVALKTTDEAYEISKDTEHDKYSLSVKSVKGNEAGEYTCSASNSAGQDEAKSVISVKPQAPIFMKEMKDLSIELGQSFRFQVEVHGFPTPTITWLKDNNALHEDGGFTLSQKDNTYTLEVKDSNLKDAGLYTCKAANSAGEESSKGSLKIQDFAPIVQQKLPQNVHLVEGDQLHLKAKVSGQPVPEVRWMKDGKPLKPSNKTKTSLLPDGTAEITVDDVTHDDSGPYRLIAVNDKGQASSESDVAVDFAEKKTKPFVRQLQDMEIITGNPLTLEAKFSGNPKPAIAWCKDRAAIDVKDAHVKTSITPDGRAILTIDRAVLEDTGEYKLTATNEMGEDSSTAAVQVSLPGKKPMILRELKPVRFTEGSTGVLETKVSGYPQPKVSWLQNGRNVLDSGHCSLSYEPNGEATLTINDITKEDGGLYTVVASNKLGKVFSEAPLTVIPVVKTEEKARKKIFEFLQGLMPVLIPEGRPLKLEAQVTTDPVPVYFKWSKDGKDLAPNERIEMTQTPDGFLRLCIKQMTLDDRGKYAVIASDGQGEIKSEAVVTMVPALPGMGGNKPYFVRGLEPVKLSEGERLTLQATLAPDMKASIKWMKDGEEISRGGRVQVLEQPDGTVALVIDGATPEDSGKYVVVASNEDGKTRSSANVAVIGHGFKLPEIVDVLKPASFLQGQPATLEAKVSGEPKPEIKWLRDGEEIEPSDRIRMSKTPDGKVALEIKDVQPEEAGKYTLLISNIGGETRCSAPVTINQPPLFASPLKAVTGVEGYPNKLEVKITGDPVPEVKWMKNGSEIPKDRDHVKQVYHPDGTASLVFEKCLPADAGKYSCTARNPYGAMSSDADMKIIGKDAEGQPKSAPTFVTQLSDISVPEGESFRLEAVVSGNPLPNVQWFLNGQPVGISDNLVPTFDGKKVSLSVTRSNPMHSGIYECKLSNDLGEETKSSGKVSVLANKIPKFIERLSDMEFSGSDEMKLMCRVEGIPTPDVTWYHKAFKIEPGLKYTISREGDKCLLVLPRPRAKDSGVYECRAKNPVGSDACSANITVKPSGPEGEPAMFLKKLRDVGVLPGMTAKFIACITGVPKPEIKWFKDGHQLRKDPRHTIECDPNGVVRLLIRSVTKSDIGAYRLSISNMLGSDTCTANLVMEGIEGEKENIPPTQEVARPDKGGPPAPLAHAPYILKMSDVSVSLAWRPSIPQYPQIPFTYRLEMCRDPDGAWTTYKSGIKDSCCDVRDLVPMIDYKFRIRVENKYGLSEPSPFVIAHRSKLLPPPHEDRRPKDYDLEHPPLEKYAAAPRFLRQEEESIYAIRGQPARVEFWVYGHPQPKISWYFNNIEVEMSKYDSLEDRNGQVILFITRMNDSDVGYYTCKAVNEHGEAHQKIKLMIAETPIFTKRLDEHTFMIRGGGQMECRVTGVPYPKIKWFKDWHPISDSSRIKISWVALDTCVLSLSNSILKDCGLYTCTATNVAGTASTSAMLNIEECESEYHILTYKRPNFVKPSDRPLEDYFDIGDELGRGTQGITYHAVERKSGRSYGAKVMHGDGKLMDFMIAEMDVMNQLCHPRLIRLWNAYQTRSSVTLVTDICGGGELLPNLLQRGRLTESIIAYYIKQLLEGLQHMHEKSIAHLGLTVGDLLVTRLNSDSIKIADFGLATRLYSGRNYIQEYGHPEFVAPEVANKQPVSFAADMWSVGIISYLLLTGDSPFLRENDRETLKLVQNGNVDFYNDRFVALSDEGRDFVANLLSIDPSKRMDVSAALKHKWLEIASLPDKCDDLNNMDQLREYYKKWRSWYGNASCRRYYRRRTLESCFTHPSRMIYPPDEVYTPPTTPDRELGRTQVKPSAFDDVTFQQRIEREPIDVRSESHYQNGPDTFLLPLRDPDFPVRVRSYLKVGAHRSPILKRHLADKHWGYGDVAVKERRKFVDVMDEEINDEKRGLSQSAPLRFRHEVGTVGSGYDKIEMKARKKKRGYRMEPGTAPYFREKIQDVVIREGQEAELSCYAVANPDAQFSWFRNDGILIESSRIEIKKWSDGRCNLYLKPAKAYDVGVYKCVARNSHGTAFCRARLSIGGVPGKPEPPLSVKCSGTEVYLSWLPPKFGGHCATLGYSLEYKDIGDENWAKAASNISHEFFLVHDLKPSTTYHFRISALNKFGWSEFSEPSEPTLTLAEDAAKIELSRAEKFQQSQTESGQSLITDELDIPKLDYGKEEDPVVMEYYEPTELYNFIAEIARGRFSMVMKVWVKKANTALMAKALLVNDSTARSAEREFDIYKSLQHERIPVLHYASKSPTSLFLVMEKLSGIDVLTYLSSKAVYTEEMISRIIRQVIDALEYLHFRGICYFELQPDNVVMVDRHNCDIKLVDFGAAQYVPDEGAKVKVHGCLEYLAPEVVKGEDVHSAVDIWGVGVLTYILLSGVSPFVGESDLETKDNILYVRYHFDHLYKEVSQEATHFLMQLFKRTPQKRPTAEECLENKWLLPNEFMIKKREHTIFISHHLREFSEKFHSLKAKSTPPVLLNIFGKSSSGPELP